MFTFEKLAVTAFVFVNLPVFHENNAC